MLTIFICLCGLPSFSVVGMEFKCSIVNYGEENIESSVEEKIRVFKEKNGTYPEGTEKG